MSFVLEVKDATILEHVRHDIRIIKEALENISEPDAVEEQEVLLADVNTANLALVRLENFISQFG